MTQTSDPISPFATALSAGGTEGIKDSLRGKYVCPFCGSVNDNEQGTCPRCTMENSAATRKATKTRIGPWYVLQTRNPAAPGMTWDTLVGFVRKGRVKPRSIVRGPTTHQLWRFAAHVKGLSREFGICYSCGTTIDATASLCPQCNRLQDPPPNPDALLEASREGQMTFSSPPATLDGAVLASTTATIDAAGPVSSPPPAPQPPPPDDGEFVIPALGGGFPTSQPNGGTSTMGSPAMQGLNPASAGPATPSNFQGITGDTSWTRIGSTAQRDPRDRSAPQANDRPAQNTGRSQRGTNGSPAGVNPNAPRFNPYADDDAPPAPGRRGDNDGGGFLSAKDLAAAFNLSFVGEDDDDGGGGAAPFAAPQQAAAGRNNGASARSTPAPRVTPRNGSPAAAARQAPQTPRNLPTPVSITGLPQMGLAGGTFPANRPPRPPRSKAKIFFAFLFLLIGGLGVALAVSGELRDKAKNWLDRVMASMNKSSDGEQLGSPGSNRKKLDGDKARKPAETNPDNAATAATPGGVRPATNPSDDPVAAAAPGDTGKPPPIPAAIAPSPGVPAAPAGANLWARTEAGKLNAEALKLEATDPALALSRYKAIKRLPPETWPTDLDASIRRTEEKLKKQVGGT